MSLAEAIVNVSVGFILAIAIQVIVFPLFGLRPSVAENLLIAAVFTLVSIIRTYLLRRLFEAIRVGAAQRRAAAR
jgi:hypothetical protein